MERKKAERSYGSVTGFAFSLVRFAFPDFRDGRRVVARLRVGGFRRFRPFFAIFVSPAFTG